MYDGIKDLLKTFRKLQLLDEPIYLQQHNQVSSFLAYIERQGQGLVLYPEAKHY